MLINIQEEYQPPRHSLPLLQVLVLAMFCVLVLRFWHLQILQGEQNMQRAYANRWREQMVHANRGLLLDSRGVILAENRPSYAVSLVREDCRDIPATLAKISQWTGEPLSKLERLYKNSLEERVPSFSPLALARDVSFEQVARIESQLVNWPGLIVESQQRRFYTYGEMFAHVLGYVALANSKELETYAGLRRGDSVGKQGLELVLENRLRGTKGVTALEVDALGRPLLREEKTSPRSGEDIRLSLDTDLQRAAMTALGKRAGSVVVMEPESGRLLALATSPAYDNNLFTGRFSPSAWNSLRNDERHPLQNRAIQSVYPPGSVWKLMMAAMFLHEGVNPDETVNCTGEFRLGNRVFRCWRAGGHGKVNMRRSLVESCDVYYYQTADRLGIDKLTGFAQTAGFGHPTGIALPSEKAGVVPGREWKLNMRGESWQRGETVNASIGQGYTLVTPVQIAVYVASLLNGGRLMKPLLLRDERPEALGGTPSTEKERAFILEAMRLAVEGRQGTARSIRRADALLGGKTGTAQVVSLGDTRQKPEETRYEYRDHAWMATWGAKGDKKYVVVALVEHGGGGSAAPVVRAVYDHLFAPETAAARGRVAALGYMPRQDVLNDAATDEAIRNSRQWEKFVRQAPDRYERE
ncbi:MAG: penicillin-binding protein 2 [Deltaproteobacteria bacterium]|jgi:penicillin-binding protein 2|nr:penicillin-binding protein 2 [Deltaproteobacteria bacterium]